MAVIVSGLTRRRRRGEKKNFITSLAAVQHYTQLLCYNIISCFRSHSFYVIIIIYFFAGSGKKVASRFLALYELSRIPQSKVNVYILHLYNNSSPCEAGREWRTTRFFGRLTYSASM